MGQRCVLTPPGHRERVRCPHLLPCPTLTLVLSVRLLLCALCTSCTRRAAHRAVRIEDEMRTTFQGAPTPK
eukprot:COSAG02_NODE_45436_length_357_cov_0.736434_1_plen_70_part_10